VIFKENSTGLTDLHNHLQFPESDNHDSTVDNWRSIDYFDIDFSCYADINLYEVLALQPILINFRRTSGNIQFRDKKLGITQRAYEASVKTLPLVRFPARSY
jgi:hypothetical protein